MTRPFGLGAILILFRLTSEGRWFEPTCAHGFRIRVQHPTVSLTPRARDCPGFCHAAFRSYIVDKKGQKAEPQVPVSAPG